MCQSQCLPTNDVSLENGGSNKAGHMKLPNTYRMVPLSSWLPLPKALTFTYCSLFFILLLNLPGFASVETATHCLIPTPSKPVHVPIYVHDMHAHVTVSHAYLNETTMYVRVHTYEWTYIQPQPFHPNTVSEAAYLLTHGTPVQWQHLPQYWSSC